MSEETFTDPVPEQMPVAEVAPMHEQDIKFAPKKAFVSFSGQGAELFGIMIVNFVFTILTLGVYHFWGKVKVRKYLWQRTQILGSPLEYTGTGMELFISFLIVLAALFVYSFIAGVVPILALLSIPVMFWCIYFAMYRSIRFRLTRTRWNGIYANLSGSAVSFANNVILLSLANILCLGFLTPYITARLYRLTLNNVYWGNMKFSFNGLAKPLYKSFFIGMGVAALSIILLLVLGSGYFMVVERTIGYYGAPSESTYSAMLMLIVLVVLAVLATALGFLYYAGAKIRWFYDHLALPGARFSSGLPVSTFMSLYLTNMLLLVFTLGFGYAWVVVRTIRYLTAAAVYQGDIDVAALQQNTQAIPARGDGLLDALDVDVAF